MRYESTIRFLARIWLDVAPMRPTPQAFARARAFLGRDDLNTGVAQDPEAGQRAVLATRTGLQFVLPGESLDVVLVPTVNERGEDRPMPTFPQFVEEVGPYMGAFARGFERPAHRVALVREGFLALTPQQMAELPARLFVVPELFMAPAPFEWDWRLVSALPREFGGVREPLNTAVTVKRATGAFLRPGGRMEPFDKVRLDFDMSTSHERSDARFNPEQVEAFFATCLRWHEELWNQMQHSLRLED